MSETSARAPPTWPAVMRSRCILNAATARSRGVHLPLPALAPSQLAPAAPSALRGLYAGSCELARPFSRRLGGSARTVLKPEGKRSSLFAGSDLAAIAKHRRQKKVCQGAADTVAAVRALSARPFLFHRSSTSATVICWPRCLRLDFRKVARLEAPARARRELCTCSPPLHVHRACRGRARRGFWRAGMVLWATLNSPTSRPPQHPPRRHPNPPIGELPLRRASLHMWSLFDTLYLGAQPDRDGLDLPSYGG